MCACVCVCVSTDRSDLWSQVSTTMSESLSDGLDSGKRVKTLIVAVQEKSTATTVGHLLLTALSSGCPALVKVTHSQKYCLYWFCTGNILVHRLR
jgi:hypothetical protein